MDRRIVPFKAWHYEWLEGTSEPGGIIPQPSSVLAQLEQQNSWTCVVDGDILCCAGTVRQWPLRHTTWALLHPEKSRLHMLWLTRAVRANLANVNGRIELTVRTDFPAGQKWARLLGFRIETPLLEKFGPEGEDHIGYVRIN